MARILYIFCIFVTFATGLQIRKSQVTQSPEFVLFPSRNFSSVSQYISSNPSSSAPIYFDDASLAQDLQDDSNKSPQIYFEQPQDQNTKRPPDGAARTDDDVEQVTVADGQGGERVSIQVQVSEIPQEFASVVGKKSPVLDNLNNEVQVTKFVGIPFAVAPLGNLRFQRPQLRLLRGTFEATSKPPPCPQSTGGGEVVGEEDCLFLSIHVPDEPPNNTSEVSDKLPVLIWYHGEGLEKLNVYQNLGYVSSGSAQELKPQVFSTKKVIVVTPQYRLGTLGFLSTANEDLNGNVGMFDQLLALEWISRYIKYFGGDPNQVTLMGHGGAAMTLGLLATSELARGLFHRVILMSGSPLSAMTLDVTPKATFAEVAAQNSCPSFPSLRFVRCMQSKSVSELVKSEYQLTNGKSYGSARSPKPILQKDPDGRFLPPIINRPPLQAFRTGNFEQVPLLIGVSSAEMGTFLPFLAGKPSKDIPSTLFSNFETTKNYIKTVLRRASFADPEMVAELAAFEYLAGLDVTQRAEQAMDLLEEMLSDYFFNIPAVTLAREWSKYAAVYFYVFDHVPGTSEYLRQRAQEGAGNDKQIITGPNQAVHGTDLNFLLTGDQGSAEDKQLHSSMVEFWVNFIHKGSPLNAGIAWPQFRDPDGGHLVFRPTLETATRYRQRQDYLWNSLVQDLSSRQCPQRRRVISSLGGSRNSVVTFSHPEDFLKYTSALDSGGPGSYSHEVTNSSRELREETLFVTT